MAGLVICKGICTITFGNSSMRFFLTEDKGLEFWIVLV